LTELHAAEADVERLGCIAGPGADTIKVEQQDRARARFFALLGQLAREPDQAAGRKGRSSVVYYCTAFTSVKWKRNSGSVMEPSCVRLVS